LEPGDEIRRAGCLAGLEASEGMQVMSLAAHRLEAPLQLAAVGIASQHGAAFAAGEAPQYAIQQAPAFLTAIARGAFQHLQQLGRYAQAAVWLRRALGLLI